MDDFRSAASESLSDPSQAVPQIQNQIPTNIKSTKSSTRSFVGKEETNYSNLAVRNAGKEDGKRTRHVGKEDSPKKIPPEFVVEISSEGESRRIVSSEERNQSDSKPRHLLNRQKATDNLPEEKIDKTRDADGKHSDTEDREENFNTEDSENQQKKKSARKGQRSISPEVDESSSSSPASVLEENENDSILE
jgi:hypothetical protein